MKHTAPLRIGIVYDKPEDYPKAIGADDRFAEFEPESTILAMESAILSSGHLPVRVGSPGSMLTKKPDADVLWNIAEGFGTRNREAWAPVLAELYGIPFLGSDAHTLSCSLDKVLTKMIAQQCDIPTPDWVVVSYGEQATWADAFPVFVKPRYEGTAKGISPSSVCTSEVELQAKCREIHHLYAQDALVEQFLPGAEYTCAVWGTPLHAEPVLERAIHADTGIGWHAVENKPGARAGFKLTHHINSYMEYQIKRWSLELCKAMEIRDFARLDFKLDAMGNPYFLEVNPLPTFAIDNTFAILAELQNESYATFLARVLSSGLHRLGLISA